MKKSLIRISFVFVFVMMLSLACGDSSEVEVTTPTEAVAVEMEQAVATLEQLVEVPTEIPTEVPQIGTRRDNPAPAGSQVRADDMIFITNSVVRPATTMVMEGNMFNSEPETNQEYMLIDVTVMCAKDPTEKCDISTYSFKALGSSGIERDVEFVSGVEGLLESSDFYGESGVRGYLPYIVDVGETDVLLVYEPLFGDSFYLALP